MLTIGLARADQHRWRAPCGRGTSRLTAHYLDISKLLTLPARLPVLLRYLRCKRCLPRGQICAPELSGEGESLWSNCGLYSTYSYFIKVI